MSSRPDIFLPIRLEERTRYGVAVGQDLCPGKEIHTTFERNGEVIKIRFIEE